MNPLIHTILISTATGDGQIVGLTRTRSTATAVLADMIECSDYDCFAATPFQDRAGIQHEIITQRSPSHSIPDRVWHEFFDLLCMRLQLQASLRTATITKEQNNLGPITHDSDPNKLGLMLCMPKGVDEKDLTINGTSAPTLLAELGFKPKPQSQPPTYDPYYKDSDIPDDIDRHESNDIPF